MNIVIINTKEDKVKEVLQNITYICYKDSKLKLRQETYEKNGTGYSEKKREEIEYIMEEYDMFEVRQ